MSIQQHEPYDPMATWRSAIMVAVFGMILQPGLLITGLPMAAWLYLRRPPWWARLGIAGAGLAAAVVLRQAVIWAWSARVVEASANWMPHRWAVQLGPAVWRSVGVEALAGPAVVVLVVYCLAQLSPDLARSIERQEARVRPQKSQRPQGTQRSRTQRTQDESREHPAGVIRLGRVATQYAPEDAPGAPADLVAEECLRLHATLLGFTGTGKTTAGVRVVEGALASGFGGLLILDGKGEGALRRDAERLSEVFGKPFRVVDPLAPETWRYNPCKGTPGAVSNKLVGAQAYGEAAEVYKAVIQGTLPLVVRALQEAGEPVTLRSVMQAFTMPGLQRLARAAPVAGEDLREVSQGQLNQRAYEGMQARLRALLYGEYGPVLEGDEDGANTLDLGEVLAGGITYFGLKKLGASEDVELFARVLIQDIKAETLRRLSALRTGEPPAPAIVWLDEFHSLVGDSSQVIDLLLQAREARIYCMVSSQFLPDEHSSPELRKALLGHGLLIAHRVTSDDAQAIADQIGTRESHEVTHQIDYAAGSTGKGSFRRTNEYIVNPQQLRELPRGEAVVKVEAGARWVAKVAVYPAQTRGIEE